MKPRESTTSGAWSYEKAMDYLNSRTNYEKKWPSYGSVTFNLDRMRRLNVLLGSPHERYPSVHLTGTKGKGSTATMVSSILQAAGLKTGLYTSPHLVNIEERIRVDGRDIPHERLAAALQRVSGPAEFMRGVAPPPHPTFFEIFTTAAFCYFAEEEVDWAVVEVGLGGRLDSTNILKPEVAAVTRIGLDHTNVLGDTVEEIATEKAGIFKAGVPAVIAPQEESVERVLRGRAGSLGAEVWGAGKEIEFGDVQPRPDGYGCRFRVKTPFAEHPGLEIRLIGEHQVENAAVAVGIIDVLRSRGKLKVTEKAIAEGLAGVEMPGRIEVMGASPWVVIDGAHNPMAIEVLVKAVRANFKYRRLVLLFAMATDKDIPGSLDIVLPIVDEVFFTLTNSPRAAKPQMLKHLAQARGKEKAHSEPDESKALEQALAVTGPEDLLLVTGSLYLAGDLRPVIQKALAGREGPMSVRGGVF